MANGVILYFLEDHELPIIHLSIAVRTGSLYDPDGQEGLAELTSQVMRTGGTGALSGDAINDTLELVAASIEPSTAMDYTNWSLDVMKKDLDTGMDVLAQILREPLFDNDKLNLAKNLKLEALRRLVDDPQKLAFREFNRLIYQGDPRGRLPSPASIRKLNRDDLVQFHQQFYFPQNMMIAISGALSRTVALEKINAYFGTWDKQGEVKPIPRPTEKLPDKTYYLVKDTPQSIVITGQFAPAKNTRDYYAFEALDYMIGSGGFRSRIFQEIRTNHGLAYSAGSFYRARTEYGIFGTYAMTKTESVPLALSIIQNIIQQAKQSPPDVKELAQAKNAIMNSFIFEYQSARQIVGQQMMLEYNQLPSDFLSRYSLKIEQLTLEDIQNVGKDHLRPEETVVLILGTREGYEKLKATHGDKNIEEIRINND